MALGAQAIVPKRLQVISPALQNELLALNTRYLTQLQKRMQYYPAQQPTDYKRTGDYGKGWAGPGSFKVSATEATLINRISYGVYVGGPKPGKGPGERQAAVMAKKGWPSISTVARDVRKEYPQLVLKAVKGRPG